MNGVISGVSFIRDYDYKSMFPNLLTDFPKTFQLEPLTIKDQQSKQACVGCATATMLEAYYGKEMSEGWNYGRLRDDDETNPGMMHNRALRHLCDIGGVPKEQFNILYEMPEMKETVVKIPELDEIAKNYKIDGFLRINQGDTTTGKRRDLEIKDALMRFKRPLFAIAPKAFGTSHAICVIGWDDTKNHYIVQNSWGKTYGRDGVGSKSKDEFREVYAFIYEPIELPFTDVNKNDWFYDDMLKAYMTGLIKGKTETEFKPFENITRAEACVMFNRLMKKIDTNNTILNKIINLKTEE